MKQAPPKRILRTALKQGAVLFADFIDPASTGRRGKPKTRPVLVLSSNAAIAAGEPVVTVCISSTFERPPPEDCIELPWDASGKAKTGLRKPSVAVTSWLEVIVSETVPEPIGYLDAKRFAEILSKSLA